MPCVPVQVRELLHDGPLAPAPDHLGSRITTGVERPVELGGEFEESPVGLVREVGDEIQFAKGEESARGGGREHDRDPIRFQP